MGTQPSLAIGDDVLGLAEDVGLDLGPVTTRTGPGRQAKQVTAEFSRALTPADFALARASGPIQAKPLAKIRDSHHSLARVLATGTSEGDASIITGYSPSRISVLKADPQFQELLEFYRSTATQVVADFRARMADMGMDALTEMRDRLQENPEDFSSSLLKDIVRDMADRTGHAPQRQGGVAVQINVGLTDRMKNARERVAALTEARRGGGSVAAETPSLAGPLSGEILPPARD